MDHYHVTITKINLNFFGSHLTELLIMLGGILFISFFAGRIFGRSNKPVIDNGQAIELLNPVTENRFAGDNGKAPGNGLDRIQTNYFKGIVSKGQQLYVRTLFRSKAREKVSSQESDVLLLLPEKEDPVEVFTEEDNSSIYQEIFTEKAKSEKQHEAESFKNIISIPYGLTGETAGLRERMKILREENNELKKTLEQQEAIILSNTSITEELSVQLKQTKESLNVLEHENGHLKNIITQKEGIFQHQTTVFKELTTQLSELQKKLQELLEEKKVIEEHLKEKELQLQSMAVKQEHTDVAEASPSVKLQAVITGLRQEKTEMMHKIFLLENQLKISDLVSKGKNLTASVDEESDMIKQLALKIRMLEGEKVGLQNRIFDLGKKLNNMETIAGQTESKDNEIMLLRNKIFAMEKDKKELAASISEWEMKYKKLNEKITHLIPEKDLEIEHLKTTVEYLEKDKKKLCDRLVSMESELVKMSNENSMGNHGYAFAVENNENNFAG